MRQINLFATIMLFSALCLSCGEHSPSIDERMPDTSSWPPTIPERDRFPQPAKPVLPDWTCPDNWQQKEVGGTTIPAYNICLPPDNWNPAKLLDWSCPQNWSSVVVDEDQPWSFTTCRPPEPPQTTCPEGEAFFLGTAGCAPVGPACPADDYPSVESIHAVAAGFPGTIHYVSATSGGDLASALSSAVSGDIIVLGKGSFAGGISVSKSVAIIGTCAKESIVIPGTDANNRPIISLVDANADALIANITVTGPAVGIFSSGFNGSINLSNVIITDFVKGIVLIGNENVPTCFLNSVLVSNMAEGLSDPYGRGIEVINNVRVIGESVTIENVRLGGILASVDEMERDGPTVLLSDLYIHNVSKGNQFVSGEGFRAEWKADVTIGSALIDSMQNMGLLLLGPEVEEASPLLFNGHDIIVSNISPAPANNISRAVQVQGYVEAHFSKLIMEKSSHMGMVVFGTEESGIGRSILTLDDVIIRDTLSEDDGAGLYVANTVDVTANRLLVENNQDTGVVMVADIGSEDNDRNMKVNLTDFVLYNVAGSRGITVEGAGMALEAERCIIDTVGGVGISGSGFIDNALDNPITITLTDVSARNILPNSMLGEATVGINFQGSVTATVNNMSIQGTHMNRSLGLTGKESYRTILSGSNLYIKREITDAEDDNSCGLFLNKNVSLTFSRIALEYSGTYGAFMVGEEALSPTVDITDVYHMGNSKYGWTARDVTDCKLTNGFLQHNGIFGLFVVGQNAALPTEFAVSNTVIAMNKGENVVVGNVYFSFNKGIIDGSGDASLLLARMPSVTESPFPQATMKELTFSNGEGRGLLLVDFNNSTVPTTITLEDYEVFGMKSAGIYTMIDDSSFSLKNGRIYNNDIGILIGTDDYDLKTLNNNNSIFDNRADAIFAKFPLEEIYESLQ